MTYKNIMPDPAYINGHRSSGLKVGDKVRIFKKLRLGDTWGGTPGDGRYYWNSSEKDLMVGKIYTILEDEGSSGFVLEGVNHLKLHFPYFVLEKIAPEIPIKKTPIKISGQTFNLPDCIISRL